MTNQHQNPKREQTSDLPPCLTMENKKKPVFKPLHTGTARAISKTQPRYKVVYTWEVSTRLREVANSARREMVGA
jgi:hypothetical protein